MKTIMLQSKLRHTDGYFISDPQHNETFRNQPIPYGRLSDLATRYRGLGFDAIGYYETESGVTLVDALTYTATPVYGQYVYDIQMDDHYRYKS